MKKIGVVTGTRAEYGLLRPVMEEIRDDPEAELCLIVTGMHLSAQYGCTWREIVKDGFRIDHKIDMQLTSDTAGSVCASMGTELKGFAELFSKQKPDILVLLGDRYEIQMAAVAAMIFCIPIAHIHGGELTEGLIDDAIRHSITKMSELHFTSTRTYADRVIQMGEQPDRVFCAGAPGVENIKNMELYDRKELCDTFGAVFGKPYVMVTYHPVTLENHTAKGQFENLLKVISQHREYHYIFTGANADPDGRSINELIEQYVKCSQNADSFVSMGQKGYLSAVKHCEFVMGNSSSGIIEAPSFHVPTLNIGDRQRGRVRAQTVVDCGYSTQEIETGFAKVTDTAFRLKCREYGNPYEGKNVAQTIVKEIKKFLDGYGGKKKKFYDLEVQK